MRIYFCRDLLRGYHALTGTPPPEWPRDYDLVADIDQGGVTGREALERAFGRAQNREGPQGTWTTGEGVHAYLETSRSMMPGDVVALDDGQLYRCEDSGWNPIGTLWAARVQGNPPSPRAERDITR